MPTLAPTNGYCTEQELRDQLSDSSSTQSQALLVKAINAASRAVDDYCGRGIDGGQGQFWQDAAPTTRTYVVNNPRAVRIDDISTRTGLVVKTGSDGLTFPTTLTAGTDFILEPRNADAAGASGNPFAFWILRAAGVLFFQSVWPNLPTVQVTAQFGWSAVPWEVNQATILKAASLFKRKDAPFGVAGFNEFGPVRITRQDPDVMELLAPFKRPMYA